MSIHKAAPQPDTGWGTSYDSGVASCAHCHEDIHRVPGGHGPTWVHDSTGAVAAVNPKPYRATHRSRRDGSEAMLVRMTAMVLRNENGDEWVATAAEWEAL
jgi:hypothetical protein